METNLLVAGFGGQGVMTLGKFLAAATCDATDKNVTFFPSYGAEQRGGTANCYVVISDNAVGTPIADEMDELIVMNQPSLDRFLGKLKAGGTLYVNSSIVTGEIDRSDIIVVRVPVSDLAFQLGNAKVLNIIMLGVYIGFSQVLPPVVIWSAVEHKFASKPKILLLNRKAFEEGLHIGAKIRKKK